MLHSLAAEDARHIQLHVPAPARAPTGCTKFHVSVNDGARPWMYMSYLPQAGDICAEGFDATVEYRSTLPEYGEGLPVYIVDPIRLIDHPIVNQANIVSKIIRTIHFSCARECVIIFRGGARGLDEWLASRDEGPSLANEACIIKICRDTAPQ